MATIRKRGKRWEARVRRAGRDVSGNFRTRRKAEVWAANIERDIEERRAGIAPRRPFSDALKRYREEVSRKRDGGGGKFCASQNCLASRQSGFFVISCGFQNGTCRAGDQVDHGDEGAVVMTKSREFSGRFSGP